jgi:hypothetical protein
MILPLAFGATKQGRKVTIFNPHMPNRLEVSKMFWGIFHFSFMVNYILG